MGTADLSVVFMVIILQMESDSIWENETESDVVEDIFWRQDSDEDYSEEQVSDTYSEQGEYEDEIIVNQSVRNISRLLGKNGHCWSTEAPSRQLMFNEQMLNIILLHTNKETARKFNCIRQQSYTKPTNKTEVELQSSSFGISEKGL